MRLKNIVTPIQAWLLSQGRCVGCGRSLTSSYREERPDGTIKIICKCGRVFIYEPTKQKYRRALFSEV